MKKCIAILFTLLLAISLVTVGFASQDFKSDVVLIVGGDLGGPDTPENPDKPEKPGKPCECKPGSSCCNPDENGDCDCDDDPNTGCTCKPDDSGDKDPSNPSKPGDSGDKDPSKPSNPDRPGDNKPDKPGDNKPSNPSKPSRPSGGGGGSSKPSKPSVKPSQNPNENKDPGDKAGGYDKNGGNYYLIEGVHVNETFREEGYMYGFKQFIFGADEYLTRAQFAAIMDRVFVFDNQKITKTFEDTRGNWAEMHINRLASNGIILGVSDTEFRPNDSLTRGHVLLMLTRVLDTAKYSKVANWDSVKAYHASSTVSRLLNSGIYDDMGSDYDINLRITRGEMVHLMNNLIYQRNVKDVETENFIIQHGAYKDLLNNPCHIYYDDCIKALNDPFVFSEVGRYA